LTKALYRSPPAHINNQFTANEFWVPLVEKAYAKLHLSYDTIENGLISDALVDLTGEVCEELFVTD
jgi:hypothetical protein